MNLADITVHIYLEILLEWLLEYSVFAFLLFLPAKRRDHFVLRLVLGLLGVAAVAFPLAIFYNFYGNTVFGRSFVYLILFASVIAVQFLCFESNRRRIFLYGNLAFAAQNATYILFTAVYATLCFFTQPYLFNVWQYKLAYYCTYAVLAFLIYFFLLRKANQYLVKMAIPKSAVFMSGMVFLVSIFLTSLHDISVERAAAEIAPRISTPLFLLQVGGYAGLFLLDITVGVVLFVGARFAAAAKTVTDLNHIIEQSVKQYEISQQTIDSINIKCHDMKHRINALVGNALPEDTIKSISDEIAIYDSIIETGNKVVDVVLSEKTLLCESKGIDFTRVVDGKAVAFMSSGDIACLLGNILDNAIEAADQVKKKNRRYVNLSLQEVGKGIVSLTCMNYYEGERRFEKGLPLTTKDDKTYHGFGMRSIKEIVHRYSGNLNIKAEKGVFEINIVFFNLAA